MRNNGLDISRRKALKVAGLTAFAGASNVVAARSVDSKTAFKDAIEQAHELREEVDHLIEGPGESYRAVLQYREWLPADLVRQIRTGEVSESQLHDIPSIVWKNFVESRGHSVTQDRETVELEDAPSGPSTQRVEDIRGAGLKGTLTGARDYYTPGIYYDHAIKLRFTVPTARTTTQCGDEGLEEGEKPVDVAGMSWYDPCYRLNNTENYSANTYHTSHVSMPEAKISRNSVGYTFDDKAWFDEWVDRNNDEYNPCKMGYSRYEWGGIHLRSTKREDSDCDTNSETSVLGMYSHTYTGSFYDFSVSAGVSAAGPTIGISFDSSSYVGNVKTKHGDDDTTWEVSLDEVEY